MSQWKDICKIDDILPETGVCALLGDEQVAIFRPYHSDSNNAGISFYHHSVCCLTRLV